MYAPLALSVHNFIDKVGSDAGFASIIGLAILVLLYFGQARETSTLRENAEQSEERVRYLEAQIAQLGRTQAAQAQPGPATNAQTAQAAVPAQGQTALRTPAPAPVPAAAAMVNPATAVATAAPAGSATAVALPAAPAGVGAPALAAATRLIPIAVPSAAPGGAAPTASAAATEAPAPVPAPAPATAAAASAAGATRVGANGSSGSGAGAPPPPPLAPLTQPPPRVQLRPGGAADAGRRPAPPARRSASPDRSRFGRGLVFALTALGVVAVVAVLLIVTSGGGKQNAKNGGTPTTNAPGGTHKRKAPAFDPSAVTVTVLNGTATSGAAAKISGQLGGAGYTEGLTTNAANQLHTASIVAYEPGKKTAALHVAKALGLSKSSVAPVDSAAQNIACAPSSTPCTADVVVTVGADLANK